MADKTAASTSSCAVWVVTWKHLRNTADGNAKERLSDCTSAFDPVTAIPYSALPYLQQYSGLVTKPMYSLLVLHRFPITNIFNPTI